MSNKLTPLEKWLLAKIHASKSGAKAIGTANFPDVYLTLMVQANVYAECLAKVKEEKANDTNSS